MLCSNRYSHRAFSICKRWYHQLRSHMSHKEHSTKISTRFNCCTKILLLSLAENSFTCKLVTCWLVDFVTFRHNQAPVKVCLIRLIYKIYFYLLVGNSRSLSIVLQWFQICNQIKACVSGLWHTHHSCFDTAEHQYINTMFGIVAIFCQDCFNLFPRDMLKQISVNLALGFSLVQHICLSF